MTNGLELTAHEALRLWHGALAAAVRADAPDLSARQLAVLMRVYLEPPPHTVRGLAKELGISKPAVSRALDALGRLGLLRRKRDEADRRNVLIVRTVAGAVFLSDFGATVARAAKALRGSAPQ